MIANRVHIHSEWGDNNMEKTWKPIVAGILDIVSGAVGLVVVLGLIIVFFSFSS